MKHTILSLRVLFVLTLLGTLMTRSFAQEHHYQPHKKTEKSLLPPFNDDAVVKVIVYRGNTMMPMYDPASSYSPPSRMLLEPNISYGSGIMVKDGMVLTAAHVIKDAKFIAIEVPDDTLGVYPALPINTHNPQDYAFLAVHRSKPFITASLPNTAPQPQPGATVFAYGYPIVPGEKEPNITKGIVTRYSTYFHKWQFDAAVEPGNSGGPIVGEGGDIIGLVVEKVGEGLNLALPMASVIQGYQTAMNTTWDDVERTTEALQLPYFDFASFVSKASVDEDSVTKKTFGEIERAAQAWDQTQAGELFAFVQELRACDHYDDAMYVLAGRSLKIYQAADSLHKGDSLMYALDLAGASQAMVDAQNWYKDHPGSGNPAVMENVTILFTRMLFTMSSGGNGAPLPQSWDNSNLSSILSYIGRSSTDFTSQFGEPDATTPTGENTVQTREGTVQILPYASSGLYVMVTTATDIIAGMLIKCDHMQNGSFDCLYGFDPGSIQSQIIASLGSQYKTEAQKLSWRFTDRNIGVDFNPSTQLPEDVIVK